MIRLLLSEQYTANMKRQTLKYKQIKHNNKLYRYYIGHSGVLIKTETGETQLVSKLKIKGQSKPSLLKRLIGLGRRNIEVRHNEVVDYIQKYCE